MFEKRSGDCAATLKSIAALEEEERWIDRELAKARRTYTEVPDRVKNTADWVN
jgi:hypothetical protein